MSKKTTKKHSVLFIPAFIVALVGLLLFGQIGRCREKAVGVVTSVDNGVTISFETKSKKIDTTPTLYMDMITKSTDYKVGESVDILYNSRDHKNFIIKDENIHILSYILLGLGVAMYLTDTVVGGKLPESVIFKLLNKDISGKK